VAARVARRVYHSQLEGAKEPCVALAKPQVDAGDAPCVGARPQDLMPERGAGAGGGGNKGEGDWGAQQCLLSSPGRVAGLAAWLSGAGAQAVARRSTAATEAVGLHRGSLASSQQPASLVLSA
jgi:hypothetical protein